MQYFIKTDSFNKFETTNTAINTERANESDYLSRMCSVVTNLVMSLKTELIPRATRLCHFGRTLNGPVATHFILLSSTVEKSGTNGYVAGPERFGQNEEPASRIEDRARKKPSSYSQQ